MVTAVHSKKKSIDRFLLLAQGPVLTGVSVLNKARTLWTFDARNIWAQDQYERLRARW